MSATDGSEMDGYEALVSELRANPPVAPERLRARVLEGAPAPRVKRSRKRKLVLVVVPLAVVLAVGAAFVHGFVSSGSPNAEAAADSEREGPRVTTAAEADRRADRQRQRAPPAEAAPRKRAPIGRRIGSVRGVLALDRPCGRRRLTPLAPLGGRVAIAVTIPRNRLVHAVASLQVGVKSKELSAKTNEASQIVGSFGGYAQSVRYQATHQGDGEVGPRPPGPGAERPEGDREARRPRHAPLAAGLDPGPAGEGDAPDERDRLAAARDRRLRGGARQHDPADPAGRAPDQAQQRAPRARAAAACARRHGRAGRDRRHLAAADDERPCDRPGAPSREHAASAGCSARRRTSSRSKGSSSSTR